MYWIILSTIIPFVAVRLALATIPAIDRILVTRHRTFACGRLVQVDQIRQSFFRMPFVPCVRRLDWELTCTGDVRRYSGRTYLPP